MAESRYALVIPGQGGLRPDGAYLLTAPCLRLLEHAARLAEHHPPRIVAFSGWSPSGGETEAAQMRAAWPGRTDIELVVEETATTTAENAGRTVPLLLERGIREAVVVCTPLHRLRVAYLFRGIYGAFGIECRFLSPPCAFSPGALAWEAAALSVARGQRRAVLAELRAP